MNATLIIIASVLGFIMSTWFLTEVFKEAKYAPVNDGEGMLALFIVALIAIVSIGGICDHTGGWGILICVGIYFAWNFIVIPVVKFVLTLICAVKD